MNALCWDYSVEDHKMLSQLKVFETLTNGNGDRLHLLARSWGREENNFEIELKRSTGMSITSRLR